MNIKKPIVLKTCFSVTLLLLLCCNSFAQHPCRVSDPTNTPLNVRTQPNGRVVATLNNGDTVIILDRSNDQRGRSWVYIKKADQDTSLGWSFADFIVCADSVLTPITNLFRSWEALDIRLYTAQWAPSAYKINHKNGIRTDAQKLFEERRSLFSRLSSVKAEHTPTIESSTESEALVRVAYKLSINFKSGRILEQSDCESYRVQKVHDRWLIVANDDYLPCHSVSAVTPSAQANAEVKQQKKDAEIYVAPTKPRKEEVIQPSPSGQKDKSFKQVEVVTRQQSTSVVAGAYTGLTTEIYNRYVAAGLQAVTIPLKCKARITIVSASQRFSNYQIDYDALNKKKLAFVRANEDSCKSTGTYAYNGAQLQLLRCERKWVIGAENRVVEQVLYMLHVRTRDDGSLDYLLSSTPNFTSSSEAVTYIPCRNSIDPSPYSSSNYTEQQIEANNFAMLSREGRFSEVADSPFTNEEIRIFEQLTR